MSYVTGTGLAAGATRRLALQLHAQQQQQQQREGGGGKRHAEAAPPAAAAAPAATAHLTAVAKSMLRVAVKPLTDADASDKSRAAALAGLERLSSAGRQVRLVAAWRAT